MECIPAVSAPAVRPDVGYAFGCGRLEVSSVPLHSSMVVCLPIFASSISYRCLQVPSQRCILGSSGVLCHLPVVANHLRCLCLLTTSADEEAIRNLILGVIARERGNVVTAEDYFSSIREGASRDLVKEDLYVINILCNSFCTIFKSVLCIICENFFIHTVARLFLALIFYTRLSSDPIPPPFFDWCVFW